MGLTEARCSTLVVGIGTTLDENVSRISNVAFVLALRLL